MRLNKSIKRQIKKEIFEVRISVLFLLFLDSAGIGGDGNLSSKTGSRQYDYLKASFLVVYFKRKEKYNFSVYGAL